MALALLTALACGGRVDEAGSASGGVGGTVSTGGSANLGGLTASGGTAPSGGSSGSGASPPDAALDAPIDAGPCVCPTTVPEDGTPCCKTENPYLQCVVCGTESYPSYTTFSCANGSWWVSTVKYAPCPNTGP